MGKDCKCDGNRSAPVCGHQVDTLIEVVRRKLPDDAGVEYWEGQAKHHKLRAETLEKENFDWKDRYKKRCSVITELKAEAVERNATIARISEHRDALVNQLIKLKALVEVSIPGLERTDDEEAQ